jgi:transposase
MIAASLSISRNTVAFWIKRGTESAGLEDQPRSGRPRVTKPATNNKIKNLAISSRTMPSRVIAQRVKTTKGGHPSHMTILRRLKEKDKSNSQTPSH